jgi:Domain of unknown function (DUF4253)
MAGTLASASLAVIGSRWEAMTAPLTSEETRAIAAFPFERVGTAGDQALAAWEQLKTAGRGVPIVLGDDRSVATLMDALSPAPPNKRTVAEILAAAEGLRHPEDLSARRALEETRARESLLRLLESKPDALPKMSVMDADGNRRVLTPEETRAAMLRPREPPPIGEWPVAVAPAPGLSVAVDVLSKRPLQKVHIALVPTDDWTTIPAHLRWGGWNDCPDSEYHVAALRSWRDRFGAELVGLDFETMNLRVTRPPRTRPEALELAREQYVYCNDIVDQGVGTLRELAASLMASDWWYFWWD